MNNFSNLREKFTNKENLNLLWNVLLDEFNINNSNKTLINNDISKNTVYDNDFNNYFDNKKMIMINTIIVYRTKKEDI